MIREPQPSPMAPAGCGLDDQQLVEQLARYRSLSDTVAAIDHAGATAQVRFAADVDRGLLEHALAVEQGCCSFFALAYDPSERVLSIATEPEHGQALSVLVGALTPAARESRDSA